MVCNDQSYVSNKINMCRNVLCKPQEEEDVASTPIVYCLFSPSLSCPIREGQVIFLRLLHKHASHRSKCRLCSGKHTFVTENQISLHYGHINKDCQNSVLHQHQFVFNFYHRAKCCIWSDQHQVPAWNLLSVRVVGHYASHAWIQDKHMHWHGKFTEDKWWNFFLTLWNFFVENPVEDLWRNSTLATPLWAKTKNNKTARELKERRRI